tara:strand:+ start:949 stop:1566 length:618 start_codon:yes stop_codon:yes gene_type:complete
MASVIKIKRSSAQGKAPTTSELATGEIAINLRDGKIFSSDGSSIIEPTSNSVSRTSGTVLVGNTNPYLLPLEDGNAGQILTVAGNGDIVFADQGGIEQFANTQGSTAKVIDTFSKTSFRSAQYFTQVVSIDGIQMSQLQLVHTDNTAFVAEFGKVTTASIPTMGSFDVDVVGDNVRLKFIPANGAYQEQQVSVKRYGIVEDQPLS